MRLIARTLVVLALASPVAAWTGSAWAVQPDEVLADPTLEARARSLSRELRCLVCQNQSIDDSAAPLARDLRVLVRERLTGGDSDQQVLDFLVDRYGEFVLLKPRFAWNTALLWLTPPGAILGGALVLWLKARRRRGAGAPGGREAEGLSPAEEARLARLMQSGER
ncbi:MAG TPA: cytochrome c-type biogenesis protein [Xanthobacteraceae bacterium]